MGGRRPAYSRNFPQGPRRKGGKSSAFISAEWALYLSSHRAFPSGVKDATWGTDRPSLTSSGRSQRRAIRERQSATKSSGIPRSDQSATGRGGGWTSKNTAISP